MKGIKMSSKQKRVCQALALASTLAVSSTGWAGDGHSDESKFNELSAQWWQWALSIPVSTNPLTELTDAGSICMVGQRGSVWFLAGTLFSGGTYSRKCSVPEGVALYFPVANAVQVNTPGICFQDAPLSVAEMRANAAAFIDGVTNMTVTLDGTAVKAIRRVRSKPFAAALPVDNVFVAPCKGDSPAGVYSPGVDDGYYVKLEDLKPGLHTLQFTALNPTGDYNLNMTYHLTVVPVSKRSR
jgi:hypothetical protein